MRNSRSCRAWKSQRVGGEEKGAHFVDLPPFLRGLLCESLVNHGHDFV
jgi:hypothetical protein